MELPEGICVIGGVERKIHFFAMDLPHSDAIFVAGYPAETTEAFCDGVPQSILYDNTRIAVARILGNGRRQRTRVFSELQSHYLFTDRFGRPGILKMNDDSFRLAHARRQSRRTQSEPPSDAAPSGMKRCTFTPARRCKIPPALTLLQL